MAQAGTMTRAEPLSWSRQLAAGSALWLCVALALEPGNLMHGAPPAWNQEVLRLGLASLLFGSAAPAIFRLARVCRLRSPRELRKMGLHAGAIGLLSLAYLTFGNLVAGLLLHGPGIGHLPQELAANFTLLAACLAALDLAAHLAGSKPGKDDYIQHVTIKSRDGYFPLRLAQVEYLEAQENYIALHTGGGMHLIRATLSSLAEKLDPALFVRVHRGTVVNRSSIEKLRPIGNGKLLLTLRSGAETVVSRAHAGALRDLWKTDS